MIACQGPTEINHTSHLINPGRPPWDAHRVHGISDQDVAECPSFKKIAGEVGSTLVDSWLVGHNVRFDTGFIAVANATHHSVANPLRWISTVFVEDVGNTYPPRGAVRPLIPVFQ